METARDKKKWGIFGNRSEIQIARDSIELLGSGGTRTMLILLYELIGTVGLAFVRQLLLLLMFYGGAYWRVFDIAYYSE